MPPNDVEALRALLPDAFSATLLDGSIAVLDSDNPIRAHLFAAGVRELLGHILHSKAPDEQVMAAPWYREVEPRPTRRQRATFAIQGGLSDELVEDIGIHAEDMHAQLVAAVKALNARTHVRPHTLLTHAEEIATFAEEVVDAVVDFLSTIRGLRSAVADAVLRTVGPTVFGKFLQETVGEIDELATHHSVEQVDVETVEVLEIGAEEIRYRAEGTVYVELLYGSGSDRARGDGASINENFPFSCEMLGAIGDLSDVYDVSELKVDTSSWYDDGEA